MFEKKHSPVAWGLHMSHIAGMGGTSLMCLEFLVMWLAHNTMLVTVPRQQMRTHTYKPPLPLHGIHPNEPTHRECRVSKFNQPSLVALALLPKTEVINEYELVLEWAHRPRNLRTTCDFAAR